jgi:hypothetical protein
MLRVGRGQAKGGAVTLRGVVGLLVIVSVIALLDLALLLLRSRMLRRG